MAIAKIKRLEVIGLQNDKEEFLSLLQKLGMVELVNVQTQDTGITSKTIDSETNLLEIEEAISFLAGIKKEKTNILESIARFKPVVYQQQLQEVISKFDYQSILKELSHLRNQLKNTFEHKERLMQEKQLLLPWRKLRISLDDLHYKQHCGIILGILNSRDYQSLSEDLEKAKINLLIETVYQDKASLYLIIFYIKEDFERLEAILKNYHFSFVTLTRHKCSVEDRLLEINREIMVLDDQIEDVKNKMSAFSEHRFKLMVIYDSLRNIRSTQEADKNLAKQQLTFTLSGWIRHKDAKILEQEVSKRFKDVAIFISEPKNDEVVPVVLENKRIIQPFEFITSIYGMPKYNELDPTPFLAPFFFIYFGFCVSDVGYGLILILLSWFVLKKIKMGQQGKKFWKLFLFCGVSTIIIGALTGSWFGNLVDLLGESNGIFLPLKRFKDSLVLLDPLKEPTKLLGVALTFAIIQVWFGNIVAAIGNIKNKRYLDVVLDQVAMLIFLFGLTGLGLPLLESLGFPFAALFKKIHLSLFKYATLLGAVMLILTQGRSEKGIGSKLFYGIYSLYNAFSGYLSDLLSYSRLWALGLVTGVMAGTINLISVQFSQIFPSLIPFVNKVGLLKMLISGIILVVIFTMGHAVSFLMNLLGAFVHPLRLQFVEFFSKFFKSGGNNFKPFKIETKYIDIN